VQVPVPVPRTEHVTRQVVSKQVVHGRGAPTTLPTQYVQGQQFAAAPVAAAPVAYGAAPVTAAPMAYGGPVTAAAPMAYGAPVTGAYGAPVTGLPY
jgi:hypothetical protein